MGVVVWYNSKALLGPSWFIITRASQWHGPWFAVTFIYNKHLISLFDIYQKSWDDVNAEVGEEEKNREWKEWLEKSHKDQGPKQRQVKSLRVKLTNLKEGSRGIRDYRQASSRETETRTQYCWQTTALQPPGLMTEPGIQRQQTAVPDGFWNTTEPRSLRREKDW